MCDLTCIWTYYNNPEMLKFQLKNWEGYPKQVPIILVDDGSKEFPAKDIIGNTKLNLRLFRVKEDIHWHQHGARNLGAKMAETPWLFMSDICRVLDRDNLLNLISYSGAEGFYYKFWGLQMPGEVPTYQHPNSFMVQKKHYWKVGGYDEDYAGSAVGGNIVHGGYGGDGIFTKSLEQFLTCQTINIYLKYYDHIYPDSKTPFPRKEGIYRENYFREMKRKKAQKDTKPKNPIRFEWEEVCLGQ